MCIRLEADREREKKLEKKVDDDYPTGDHQKSNWIFFIPVSDG